MIEQQARVVRTAGDQAWVRVGGQSGCAACDAGKGCGAGIFGRLLRRKPVEFSLANSVHAETGQPVRLGLPESLFLRLVFRLYGVPVLAGLVGGAICHQISGLYEAGPGVTDLVTLLGLLAGAGMALILGRRRGPAGLPKDVVRLLGVGEARDCDAASALTEKFD